MPDSKITLEMVKGAYKKLGVTPTCCDYFRHHPGGKLACACPLTALYLDEVHGGRVHIDEVRQVTDWAADKFGEKYQSGFVEGVDIHPAAIAFNTTIFKVKAVDPRYDNEYCQGFLDGLTIKAKFDELWEAANAGK